MKKIYEVKVWESYHKTFKVEAQDAKEAEELVETKRERGELDMAGAKLEGRDCYADDHPDDPDKFGSFRVSLSVDFREWYNGCILKYRKGDKLFSALEDAKERMINGEFNFGLLKNFDVHIRVDDDCGDDYDAEAFFHETIANKKRFLTNFRDAINKTLECWTEESENKNNEI
jgi:hypothetical protein